jgi:peptidoglycan/xylan/chitin deacetylase (PgdA/CDA1 family)
VGLWLKGTKALPSNSLAVTVDDGYRDVFCNAYPIFRAHEIPVTIFLATDFLDRKCWLWVDRIEHAFRNTRLSKVRFSIPTGGSTEFCLDSTEDRQNAISAVKAAAKTMSNQQRISLLEYLPDLLKIDWPIELPEQYQPLKWDEVRQMSSHKIDFGAHTKTHPILSSLDGKQERLEEINGSKARIERELGKPVRHFSYPNGTWRDMEFETVDIVKKGGFCTAVVAQGGVNFRNADPYLLRRNTVEPTLPELFFGRYVTGFRRG